MLDGVDQPAGLLCLEWLPFTRYREALELLEEAEQVQSWFDPEQTCSGKSKEAACWMELTSQPGCYVWNGSLSPDATLTWTGGRSGGRA